MSRNRIEVQYILEEAMTKVGYTPHVYYQPPGKLEYPCIVYNRERFNTVHANNRIYKDMAQYTVTVMEKNPESPLVNVLRSLDYCEMDREFTTDHLHHFVFTLYY